MKPNLQLKVDNNIVKGLEASITAHNLDDLFEITLSNLLHIKHVCKGEIFLYDKQNNLMPVASALNVGPKGKQKQEIRVQSWTLHSPVKHSTRRTKVPNVYSVCSIPLLESDKLLGFLSIELDKIPRTHEDLLSGFYLIGLHLSTKIKEIMLQTEIKEVKSELTNALADNKETQQHVTSLSKELYAVSAISTKINQSMNFKKSLRKSMVKIREVFKAAGVIAYFRKPGSSKLKLSAIQLESDHVGPAFLEKVENFFLPEIVSQGRPLIKNRYPQYHSNRRADQESAESRLIVGTPIKSKEKIIGALVLLHESSDSFNQASLRLLSGIANIMGMAIENMNLYRQSQHKKRQAAYLVESISKFNETLDLEVTLKSVAKKGAEFIGKKCRVYLFSETKIPLIHVRNQIYGSKSFFKSISYKTIQPQELEDFYLLMRSEKRPILIKNINSCKKIGKTIKPFFGDQGIQALMIVPLRLMRKKVGLLILSNGGGKRTFDHHDLNVAEALGAAASVAIENARAYTTSVEMSDFLEKKISEKSSQLRKFQERQKIRVENRKDIIFRVNKRNRFVFVNKAMENLTGYTKEELYSGDIQAESVIAPEDRERVRNYFRRVIRSELSLVKDLQYRHLNQKGEDHIISLTIYPEKDRLGRVIGVEGVGEDITEKKRLESELEKAKDLALLGEFSSAIAHQIRNPLGNILMGTKLLQKELGMDMQSQVSMDSKSQKSCLLNTDRQTITDIFGDLTQGIHNLNQVVTGLLEYTKTLKLSRSSQKIEIILRETLNRFRDLIKQNDIKVEEQFDQRLAALSVDAMLIGHVFQNVIHNAIQAMPKGGDLFLFSGPYPNNSDYAFISINDSGPGIDPSEAEKVFRPFYTTKDQGTGLGLSLAHRIIEAHNGMMWVCHNPCHHFIKKPVELIIGADNPSSRGASIHILLPIDGHTKQKRNRSYQAKYYEREDTRC